MLYYVSSLLQTNEDWGVVMSFTRKIISVPARHAYTLKVFSMLERANKRFELNNVASFYSQASMHVHNIARTNKGRSGDFDFVIDMVGVDFIHSSGIGSLIKLHREISLLFPESRITLMIEHTRELQLLKWSGLEKLFHIRTDRRAEVTRPQDSRAFWEQRSFSRSASLEERPSLYRFARRGLPADPESYQ